MSRSKSGTMCFKITPALREYYHYRGVSAELERRGYGSSRPELAWANRQKPYLPETPVDDHNKGLALDSLKNSDAKLTHH
jgi:hypothetical protein